MTSSRRGRGPEILLPRLGEGSLQWPHPPGTPVTSPGTPKSRGVPRGVPRGHFGVPKVPIWGPRCPWSVPNVPRGSPRSWGCPQGPNLGSPRVNFGVSPPSFGVPEDKDGWGMSPVSSGYPQCPQGVPNVLGVSPRAILVSPMSPFRGHCSSRFGGSKPQNLGDPQGSLSSSLMSPMSQMSPIWGHSGVCEQGEATAGTGPRCPQCPQFGDIHGSMSRVRPWWWQLLDVPSVPDDVIVSPCPQFGDIHGSISRARPWW